MFMEFQRLNWGYLLNKEEDDRFTVSVSSFKFKTIQWILHHCKISLWDLKIAENLTIESCVWGLGINGGLNQNSCRWALQFLVPFNVFLILIIRNQLLNLKLTEICFLLLQGRYPKSFV